ncbi:hypothetical protein [Actinomycetospora termitidis]|uniref:Uncharacterized protein n=1 Tax=Actinomycetospora termitidis TaxID=3053470 RepID=A0ABT7MIJ7_9PSEU|nr:hypothetical protein [Actinomycetospora sp. Odt1-22]MDL5160492.1 hypothetical protein [Actinomycetospora sp. Odt1-22]
MSVPENRAARQIDDLAQRYGLEQDAARAAVEDTYRAVAEHSGPALTLITADILDGLREDLAVRPEQVSVFVGRDGFPLAAAAQALEAEFVAERTRTVALSRVVLEQALRDLETHTGRGLELPEAFRLASAAEPERPGAYRQLTRYLHASGIPAGLEGSAVAIIDTSYKGTGQEMLAAAFPATDFRGHYAYFGAHPQDPHPGSKTGHALHLDPDPSNGIPTRVTELPVDPALTFAHPDAIAAVEDLHHGTLAKPRAWEQGAPQLRGMRTETAELADINPARLAPGFADPLTREACHDAALRAVGDVAAAAGAARRAGDPNWRAELEERSRAFTDQVRAWIAQPDPTVRRGLDARLGRVLDGFAHRQDRDALQRIDAVLAAGGFDRGGEPAMQLWRDLAVSRTPGEREQVVLRACELTADAAVRPVPQAAPPDLDARQQPGRDSPVQERSQAGVDAAREAREQTQQRRVAREVQEAEGHRRRVQHDPVRQVEQQRDRDTGPGRHR